MIIVEKNTILITLCDLCVYDYHCSGKYLNHPENLFTVWFDDCFKCKIRKGNYYSEKRGHYDK